MKLGFALPQIGTEAGPDGLIRAAGLAEKLQYDSVWVLERVLWPVRPLDKYPATPDGSLPEPYQFVLDPIETLTYVAGITNNVKLGTSVLVAPWHSPLLAARRLATLDVLSKGRLLCGLGVGWSHDEYAACGVPFANREARMKEWLEVLVAIWTQDTVEYKGQYYTIPASKIGPKPVQKPHPPIYQAAYTPRALQRTGLFQGWNPTPPPNWDWLQEQSTNLRQIARQAGRNPDSLEIVLRTFPTVSKQPRSDSGWLFTGIMAQIKDDAKRAAELGVTHIVMDLQFNTSGLEALLQGVEQLRELA